MMQRFKGGCGGKGWWRIDIMNGYLVNPSHNFTCILVKEKILMEKFSLKLLLSPSSRIRLLYLSKIHFWMLGEDYAYLSRNYDRRPDSASSSITVLLFSIEKSVEIRVTKENNFFLYWVDSSFTFLFARNKSSGTIQQADCKCEEIPGLLNTLQLGLQLQIDIFRTLSQSFKPPLRRTAMLDCNFGRAAVAAINMNTASFLRYSFARAVNSIHSEREWCLGALQTVIARKRRKQKTMEDA
ncbi:hypothetical protein ALC53_01594 [Atta colombica]|uniref:Uncharacterized protein n=1 Tax=Atta colombica TaxID=520822 RepID=A0A195BV09_9HYME|nr:hypothetical protein ALC53_01594 [Atta colombica]